ncbi:polyribonucleotide nucleotidyltransferase [Candidatus Wolfebacteria bacterium CG10_big_fil_rev_8_21_14_0_10_31_9]|uniref:Polyribonucleotide nucleotidyltransferase n=1 Tax=Candidatus Wolfebacteria bacterium CG10_big_fil_rev_8_21_14_0_10_31_9 TaxID=1975070 RepID=A0A2H0RC18_9BACT|nr:MAG: polyribonucleotide nucleotidyltransferase [Candidatus Wolfebacteria bacterium CG10_big_fil_rev_8_21_14_0_10_31_9]
MLNKQEFQVEVAGKPFKLTVSEMANQANSSVMCQYGDTIVLATVVMGNADRPLDYFPLTVDYEERFYAAGKILGSRFVRREGRPTNDAILSGRLIDRTLRPLFDSRIRRDVQVVLTILSYDELNDPDFVSLVSASSALFTSDIPWGGPIAGVRVIKLKSGEVIINPTVDVLSDKENIIFEAFVSGTEDKINMLEVVGKEADEKDILDSFEKAHNEIKKIIEFQKEVAKKIGKAKASVRMAEPDIEVKNKIVEFLNGKLENAVYVKDKAEQGVKISELKNSLMEYLKSEGVENLSVIDAILEEETDKLVHKNVLESDKRPDGRKLDEVRPLYSEVGLFKRLHGSAFFMRGGTQTLAVTTLAAPGSEQLVETMESTQKRRFMLHYNFPPYATGEVKKMGGTGRREIGHGALAEKAISSMIPTQEEFPYTIRVVSEVLASNGSSSMATVCASSMSLMDAGVPIKKPVAGIAMGLIVDQQLTANSQQPKYKILTDIQGPEDHYGDMDCKVAGTKDGVNAMQMDVKINGVTVKMLGEIMEAAKKARLQILDVMNKAIPSSRPKVSDFAPVIITIDINPEKIGEVIGPGGKMINAIIAETGVLTIDIEQNGKVFVAAPNQASADSAINAIKSLTKEYQVGEMVEGNIVRILEFGAIVDLGGGRDGMIHVSELKSGFVKKVEDVVKLGDFVKAKVIKTDNGKIGLSIKALESGI